MVINRIEQVCQLRDIRGDKHELVLNSYRWVHYIVKLWSIGVLSNVQLEEVAFYLPALGSKGAVESMVV
jgi:hypothetical protein